VAAWIKGANLLAGMSVTANLRRDARLDVRVPVVIIRGKSTVELESLDVSFRGLFLKCVEPPALRSLVRLKVVLPSRTIEVHAMAVHVVAGSGGQSSPDSGGVGLQFWGLSGTDRQAWEDFIRTLIAVRRDAAKKAAQEALSGPHPATTEMNTPSGIRTVAGALGSQRKAK
jgi:hypothetical protein